MGRIRTTRQAQEIRSTVLARKDRKRELDEWMINLDQLQKDQAELQAVFRRERRKETMKKFQHRRPTSL